jgi:hypothetical protein
VDNTGREYEKFVEKLIRAILYSENFTEQKNVLIERNKFIIDKNDLKREFDLYWEYAVGGFTYKTVIECKDYNSPISIEKIDALLGKIRDIPDLKPVFATKTGYQSGAKIKAEKNGIDLIIVREQNDSDWLDEYGFHLLKGITITGQFIKPARITNFQPELDGRWIIENAIDLDITKPFHLDGLNIEIFIDDISDNEKYSLYDLAEHLTILEENKPGDYERTKIFTEAYLLFQEKKYKMRSYKVLYTIPEPIEYKEIHDFTQELLGAVEYIKNGVKLKIFKNGSIQKEKLVM